MMSDDPTKNTDDNFDIDEFSSRLVDRDIELIDALPMMLRFNRPHNHEPAKLVCTLLRSLQRLQPLQLWVLRSLSRVHQINP